MTTRTSTLTLIIAFFALIIGTLALTTTPAPAAAPAPATERALDRDCGDFSNQAAAQRYYIDRGGPDSDPDALDADGDGVACESNPCPCSTAQGGGGGGGGGGGDSEPSQPKRISQKGRVIEVIDGDTVDVRLNAGKKVRVRMIGIDTPEVFGGVECGGPAASRTLKNILPRNTRVTLVSDRSQPLKDRFGRVLRYVKKNGRQDVNRTQLVRGNATVLVVGKRFEKFTAYKRAAASARRKDRGIWGRC